MPLRLKTNETAEIKPAVEPTYWPRPQIMQYGPRIVRLTKAAKMGMAAFVTLSALGLIAGGGAATFETQKLRQLAGHGKVVTGRIQELELRRGEKRSYRLHYEFTMNGKRIRGYERVRNPDFDAMQPGRPVEITALPSNPAVHEYGRVTWERANQATLVGGSVIFLLVAAFGGAAALMRLSARKEAHILSNWVAASAQVLDAKPTVGKSGTSYDLRLRYPVSRRPDAVITTRATKNTKWQVAPGDFLDVLYDPENPEKARVRESLTMVEVDPDTY